MYDPAGVWIGHTSPVAGVRGFYNDLSRIECLSLFDRLCAIAFDQSVKGRGYPVCLAEAHEQAVVKGGDREFFYHLLCKVAIEGERRIRFSEKAIKKRGIGI